MINLQGYKNVNSSRIYQKFMLGELPPLLPEHSEDQQLSLREVGSSTDRGLSSSFSCSFLALLMLLHSCSST
jgi:hypothetical protein